LQTHLTKLPPHFSKLHPPGIGMPAVFGDGTGHMLKSAKDKAVNSHSRLQSANVHSHSSHDCGSVSQPITIVLHRR